MSNSQVDVHVQIAYLKSEILKGRRNQDFYSFKISQMNTNHHLRKNDVICACRESIMNFFGKWKPPPSHRAAMHRRGAPMRRNRELGNLFHNLSASKCFPWLVLFLNGLQMWLKQKKLKIPSSRFRRIGAPLLCIADLWLGGGFHFPIKFIINSLIAQITSFFLK